MAPSLLTSAASRMAQENLPRKPYRTFCGSMLRCMSKKRVSPALMRLRRSGSDWYGVRQAMALARASSPSNEGPVEAPVTTPI